MEEVSISESTRQLEDPSLHRMVVLQPGERIVCVINRHPFGIISQYIGVLFVVLLAGFLTLFTAPKNIAPTTHLLLYVGLGVLVAALVGITGAATRIYWQCRWIITTDSLTQISQVSLFSAQVSALSLAHLEDVTVYQRNILQRIFNYGTLRVETAGERSKFSLSYCPDPVEYARKIIDAREKFTA
jgi:hypothetical protein